MDNQSNILGRAPSHVELSSWDPDPPCPPAPEAPVAENGGAGTNLVVEGAPAKTRRAALLAGNSGLVSLAHVLEALEANPSRDRRHVEMKSAVRRLGVVLRRSLFDIPADPVVLRWMMAEAPPACVGMTKERWGRVKSLVSAALRDFGLDMVPGRDIGGVDPAWGDLREKLPTQALRYALSRFMSYCTRAKIEPTGVTARTFDGYLDALHKRSLRSHPESLFRAAVRAWNNAVEAVDEWPRTPIPLGAHKRFYSLPWASFPASLTADVEAFLANSGNQDVFADDYVPPVKASTVALRRRQLRQMLSMLVASGTPIDAVVSLALLTEPDNAKAALRSQRGRDGGAITTALGQKAWLLVVVARYWVKDGAQAEALREIAKRVSSKPKAMTPRNRTRLLQFDLKANLDALLDLPDKVIDEARRDRLGTIAEARRVMYAFAVECLTVAPTRIDNLAGLEHGRHILTVGRGRERNRHIVIPAAETKTGAPFEMKLPARSARLMDIYLGTYRNRICPDPSPFLFPAENGGRRNKISFSRGIATAIERQTGIQMHVHLFRALAGKLHLDENPNDIETVRRVLGHSSSATTARYYVEQRTDQAFQAYDDTLEKRRSKPKRTSPRRPARKPRSPRKPDGAKP